MYQQVLDNNYAEVKRLLRRRNVIGEVNPATIEKAFKKHGEKFMLELLEIITPEDSNFTGLFQPLSTDAINYAQTGYQIPELELENAVKTGGKFWSFWDNLLNRVDNTGKTIGQFKADTNQKYLYNNQQAQFQAAQNNTRLIYAGAGFLVVVILLLIFKK